jgi:signal transduction histidine kinase
MVDISVKAEKENIFYEICDSGSGFSKKDLEKAFDKFYRGNEARRSTAKQRNILTKLELYGNIYKKVTLLHNV